MQSSVASSMTQTSARSAGQPLSKEKASVAAGLSLQPASLPAARHFWPGFQLGFQPLGTVYAL